MDYHAERRARLRQSLEGDQLAVLLVTNPVNVTYLTGFSGDSGILVFSRDREILVSDARFAVQITEECPALQAHIRPVNKTVYQEAGEVLSKLCLTGVEVESHHLTLADLETLQSSAKAVSWKPGTGRVEKLRAVKDADEIAQIQQAIDIAERAYTVFRALLQPDDTEKRLCDSLESYVRQAGGQGTSFSSIVAVGERAALPHAPPTNRALHSADFLLIDWGAAGRFYKSDLTRVIPTFRISSKLKAVHEVVLKAQTAAIQAIRPGVAARDVDAVARNLIAQAGYGDYFGHGLGHGIGLQVHEAPSLRANSEAVLEAGMVVTVEPGIYLPDWGGVRIEDDVLVTPEGREVLSRVSPELECIFPG